MNYFISLDALFGIRGHVEASLIDGVIRISSIDKSAEMMAWLFDLRNELVHGSARNIHEWLEYSRYLKYFESEPQWDIERICLDCIGNYPGFADQHPRP